MARQLPRLIYSDADLPPAAKTEIDARIIARRLIKIARAIQRRSPETRSAVLIRAADDYYEHGGA
jgi:hypothetical protein